MSEKNILVSVVVITYNSSETVIETLDSIYKQTYQNLELIISDDCSKDDTVTICENWIKNNKDRFKKTLLITTPVNTGTSGNLNRAINRISGVWCKSLAADDRLLPDCIEKCIKHIEKHPKQRIIFSKVKGFGNMEAARKWPFKNVKWLFDTLSSKEMKILLTQRNFLPAASVIIKKDVYDQIGGFNESIPLLEDWPFWVKAVFNNIPLSFYDEEVVEYRFGDNSISQGENGLSQVYKESYRKSAQYAHGFLKDVSSFMRFYSWTLRLQKNGFYLGKLLHAVNILNPDYYKQKQAMKKYQYFIDHHIEL